jgi:hypothetical protein
MLFCFMSAFLSVIWHSVECHSAECRSAKAKHFRKNLIELLWNQDLDEDVVITLTAKNPQVPNFFSITDSKLARLFLDFFIQV